ncbi:MAG: imidazole glycerol phosphate synthase cyclase subunit, partial [Patescibacteria group bacterium]
FSVGGGIRSVSDMQKVLLAGADKISINSAAVLNPKIILEGAKLFGSQCIVLGIDVQKNKRMPSGYEIVIAGGRNPMGIDAINWVQKAEKLGAGEICVNSIDEDGRRQGYDLDLLKKVKQAVKIPVIASGGVGNLKHLAEGAKIADAVLAASIFHYKKYTIPQVKKYLNNLPAGKAGKNICVRI